MRPSADTLREYETLFVLKPDIEDQAAIDFIQKMKALVEREGGKHIKVTNWGRKKLAWERKRNQKGMFVYHKYLGPPTLVKEYERTLGIEEAVLLRQTVLLEKAVLPDQRQPEEDQLAPPATKERRDERDRDDEGMSTAPRGMGREESSGRDDTDGDSSDEEEEEEEEE